MYKPTDKQNNARNQPIIFDFHKEQTDRQRWKHNLHPPSVVEVTNTAAVIAQYIISIYIGTVGREKDTACHVLFFQDLKRRSHPGMLDTGLVPGMDCGQSGNLSAGSLSPTPVSCNALIQ